MSAKPRAPVARSVKTPAALAALRGWLGGLDPVTRQRGADYQREGKVVSAWAAADHYVSAEVEGGNLYEVTLFYTRGAWNSSCTCPVGRFCKHACAAGLAWIGAVESGAADRDELTPDPVPTGPDAARPLTIPPVALPPVVTTQPRKAAFREQWAPVLAKKLGRGLTAAEGLQLEALAGLFHEFQDRHRMLFPDTLRKYGFGSLVPAGVYGGPVFGGWWTHDTAPADPWALWQYLAYELERTGGAIPVVFEPMTDTSGIEAAMQASSLRKEIDDWRDELIRGSPEPTGAEREPLPRVAGLRARFSSDGWLYIETRAAEAHIS